MSYPVLHDLILLSHNVMNFAFVDHDLTTCLYSFSGAYDYYLQYIPVFYDDTKTQIDGCSHSVERAAAMCYLHATQMEASAVTFSPLSERFITPPAPSFRASPLTFITSRHLHPSSHYYGSSMLEGLLRLHSKCCD